jgi:hypothetical protein
MTDRDDFVEIVKAGLLRVPCTLVCRENRKPRGEGTYRRVSMSFRPSLLPPEAVEILKAPGLRAAFSPSQRVFRVTADPTGQFKLTRAPKTDDVFFIRFPYSDNMPWVEKRVEVEVDVNPGQSAIFLEVPGVTPERRPVPQLEAVRTVPQLARAEDQVSTVEVRRDVCSPPLAVEEAALLSVLSDGNRYYKEDLVQHMQREGHGRVSVNSVLGKVRYKLMDAGVEPTESTDKTQVWLSPMAMTALRRLLREAA